jgi:cell wall-associated NlpC family hydrolase
MRAWEAGGIALPHSSRLQYSTSTAITEADLQPGDLVFWGSSPGSIYHVGLYTGDGMMVHAPRTGDVVKEVSIHSWTSPSFFARP